MKFEIEYIEKLAKVIADNELTEISLEDGIKTLEKNKIHPQGTIKLNEIERKAIEEKQECEEEFVGANYGTFKKAVADVVCATLEEIQAKYHEVINSGKLEEIFGTIEVVVLDGEENEFGFMTEVMSEGEYEAKAEKIAEMLKK